MKSFILIAIWAVFLIPLAFLCTKK